MPPPLMKFFRKTSTKKPHLRIRLKARVKVKAKARVKVKAKAGLYHLVQKQKRE